MRWSEEEEDEADDSAEEEEEGGGVHEQLNNLRIETAGTEEEAAERLAASLAMEVEGDRGERGQGRGRGYSKGTGSP